MVEEGSPFEFYQIKLHSYHISYVKIGAGPIPIFAFPGLLGTLRQSGRDLILKIGNEQDGQKYSLYTWDPPGYFLSRPPFRKEKDVSFDFDSDLGLALMKHLEPSKPWVVLGYSAGTQVALKLTLKNPDLVSKLVLWGGWDLFEDSHLPVHLTFRNLNTIDPTIVAKRVAQHGVTYDQFEKSWHAWMDMIQREYFHQDKDQWVKKFQKVNCPTLIIAGENDFLAPVSQSEWIHQNIKGSRLEILPGADHFMQVTHTGEMHSLIENFLSL